MSLKKNYLSDAKVQIVIDNLGKLSLNIVACVININILIMQRNYYGYYF